MYWILLAVLVIIYVVYRIINSQRYWEIRGVTHIKPWPLLRRYAGNYFRRENLLEQFQVLYNYHPDAKVVGLQQFTLPILMIRDPEIIRLITIKNFDYFMNHKVILTEDIDPLFGKNLVSLQGQKWKDMRSTLSPAFTSSKMRTMFVLINDCAQQFAEYFLKKAENKVYSVEMKDICTRYANDIIASTAFGIKCDSLKDKTNEFFMAGQKCTTFDYKTTFKIVGFLFMMPVMKFFNIKIFGQELEDFFRDIIKTTISTREEKHIIRPDLIHLLMEARKGKLKHDTTNNVEEETGFATVQESNIGKTENEDKSKLTDEDITAQALLFFVAGYETISTMMTFMAYELALNPDIQKKMQEEIDEVNQKCNGSINYESLLKMKYLDMVISESLRKWPPAILTERICERPYNLILDDDKSVQIEKNVSIWMLVYCLHHDPKYFPDPEKFDPERFSDENKNNILPFTYLPFGAGPRNCIGSRFALLEIKALLVHLLSKFEFVVTEKTEIPMKLNKSQFKLLPEKGCWLGLKPREK